MLSMVVWDAEMMLAIVFKF